MCQLATARSASALLLGGSDEELFIGTASRVVSGVGINSGAAGFVGDGSSSSVAGSRGGS